MDFETAAAQVKSLKTSPSNDELLELYGLYKQATTGDNNTSKPWVDPKGRAKWEAWEGRKGMSQDDAKAAYIEVVQTLLAKYPH
uniref:ACB domain-containing protein n=1 Tax=Plectus sambesii TaxID=2011161 RepID=A0A914XK17_9BILA